MTNTDIIKNKNIPLWLKQLPNQLTMLRILCIPIVVILMLEGASFKVNKANTPQLVDIFASIVFGIAAITDFFDGWIARKFNVESLFGKLLDPLADKLLVISALIILVEKHRLAAWIAVVLIVRDLAINAVRIAALEEKIEVPSSWIGKTKTFFLDWAMGCFILNGTTGNLLNDLISLDIFPFRLLGIILIYLALAASLISAIQYLIDYAKESRKQQNTNII